VTNSSPNLQPAGNPPQPDYLATGVLNGLARGPHAKLSWSVFRTALVGAVTFGLAPILAWQVRFRDYVTWEQQQLWHLAEWLRLKSKSPDAAKLRQEADALRFRFDLQLLASLCVAFVAVAFFSQIMSVRPPHRWALLLDSTYRFPEKFGFTAYALHWTSGRLFAIWTVGLSAAYFCHWMQVQMHATTLRRWIARFDNLAVAEGIGPVLIEGPGLGVRPLWAIAAVIFCAAGAFWAPAMMLAGAAHRRMVRSTSPATRKQLAQRFRLLMLSRSSAPENVPTPVSLRRLCPSPICRAPVIESATFCPRCGRRLA
jgi:hypothetical protein